MTTIAPPLHIVGDILSDEDLLIEGRIEGNIHVPDALLTIEPQARIEADVRGKRVTIHGTVRGSIAASERIELTASASVDGHLTANHIVIMEGATFNGRIDMGRRGIAATVARYKNANA